MSEKTTPKQVCIPSHEECAEQQHAAAKAWQAEPLTEEQRKSLDADQDAVAKEFGWTE